MNKIFTAFLLFATLAAPAVSLQAALYYKPHTAEPQTVVLKLSDLRSAYLQRAGIVRYDQADMSPAGLQRQLQRHFDTVLGLLFVSTPQSIDTALSRLEAADDHTWSAKERAERRQQLLASRFVQMQRLAVYRDRGRFPLNEAQASSAVPIFVDKHDTACAVGQLMRWSGWEKEVASIQHSDNLVYVPDAISSDVAKWALTSGVTVEEAALIQPAYGLYAPFSTSDHEPGEPSFSQNGLTYSNFRIESQNYIPTTSGFNFHAVLDYPPEFQPAFLTPTSGGPQAWPYVGFNAGTNLIQGLYSPSGPPYSIDPIGSHWLVLGGQSKPTHDYSAIARFLNGSSSPSLVQRIKISFDVATPGGNTFFNQIATHSLPQFNGLYAFNSNPTVAEYELTTSASSASLHFEEPDGDLWNPQSASANLFAPRTSLSVSTTVWLYNGASVGSLVFGFNVVPEPTTGTLLVCCLGVAVIARRSRDRRS